MVCLGNICRSPLAEGILRHKLHQSKVQAIVDSAGTAAYHVGEAPDSRSVEVAARHGVSLKGQRARAFSVEDFDRFDRIYAMDKANYRHLISMARNQADRDKTDLILNLSHPGSNREVPDPYYGGRDGFQKVYDMLDEACDILIDELRETTA